MLAHLRVRNLAIVKDLSLAWGAGLNLLTGETGAGKSILVEALGLVLGERAAGEWVRSGESRAEIEAVFRLGGLAREARSVLEASGLEPEGDEVIIRREIGDASRSRQFVCDRAVSLATLRRLGEALVEIQGQHEHLALLSAEAQREALDRHAGLEADLLRMGELARAGNEAAETLSALEARLENPEARLDFLRYQLRELEALEPSAEDEAALRSERALLLQATRRRELAEEAYRSLHEEDGSASERLSRALSCLSRLGELDPRAEPWARSLEPALAALDDVAREVGSYRDRAEPDPLRLESVEERLSAYESLARKHGTTPGGLAGIRDAMAVEAGALEAGDDALAAARERSTRARAAYMEAARALTLGRRAGARRLGAALARELESLAMGRCGVEVDVLPRRADEPASLPGQGMDAVQIRLSPNPGEPPKPLAEIVSGGELSRVMLAVNTVLGRGRTARTLIFDEIDAGLGGREASVIGQKLRALTKAHQVIVITHLPQIASLADSHFVVEKSLERGRTVAHVRELNRSGRVAELTRMMGGREGSTIARRHASDMLRQSASRPERRTS